MTFLLILKSDTDSAELVSKNQHKDIKLKDVACELWLHELSYQKKIFQPGMVLAKLQLKRKEYPVDQKNIGIPTEDIVNYFKDNVLKVTRDGKDVATDYYIYKVLPEFRRDSDANQYVELTCYCYSRDHKLTLHPYSKMYVNKKLVGDLSKSGKDGIIQTEMDGILKKAGFDDKTIDCGSLRFLKYITKPEKKDEKGNVVQKDRKSMPTAIRVTASRSSNPLRSMWIVWVWAIRRKAKVSSLPATAISTTTSCLLMSIWVWC